MLVTQGRYRTLRLPDLIPFDFCIWVYLKSLVYFTPVEKAEDLRNRIFAEYKRLRNTPGIFVRIRQSMRRRVAYCNRSEESRFEQLM